MLPVLAAEALAEVFAEAAVVAAAGAVEVVTGAEVTSGEEVLSGGSVRVRGAVGVVPPEVVEPVSAGAVEPGVELPEEEAVVCGSGSSSEPEAAVVLRGMNSGTELLPPELPEPRSAAAVIPPATATAERAPNIMYDLFMDPPAFYLL